MFALASELVALAFADAILCSTPRVYQNDVMFARVRCRFDLDRYPAIEAAALLNGLKIHYACRSKMITRSLSKTNISL